MAAKSTESHYFTIPVFFKVNDSSFFDRRDELFDEEMESFFEFYLTHDMTPKYTHSYNGWKYVDHNHRKYRYDDRNLYKCKSLFGENIFSVHIIAL